MHNVYAKTTVYEVTVPGDTVTTTATATEMYDLAVAHLVEAQRVLLTLADNDLQAHGYMLDALGDAMSRMTSWNLIPFDLRLDLHSRCTTCP